jgi:hypothetical protein
VNYLEIINLDIVLNATYDGKGVITLNEQIPIPPNTPIRVKIFERAEEIIEKGSFLKTAASLNLDGPSDWSENIENYLYNRMNDFGK